MTVHMVRVYCDTPKGDADIAVDNWVSNYNEWTGDPTEHTLTETQAEPDGSGTAYLVGSYRFVDQGETPTSILDDLSNRLQSFQSGLWHRIGYHVCDHDESSSSSCSWSQTTEYGNIPTDVPEF